MSASRPSSDRASKCHRSKECPAAFPCHASSFRLEMIEPAASALLLGNSGIWSTPFASLASEFRIAEFEKYGKLKVGYRINILAPALPVKLALRRLK